MKPLILSLLISSAAFAGQRVPVGNFLWNNVYYYEARAELERGGNVRISGRGGSVVIPFEKAPAAVKKELEKDRAALMKEQAERDLILARSKWRVQNKAELLIGKVTQVLPDGFLFMQDDTLRIVHVAGKTAMTEGERATIVAKRGGNYTYTTVLRADSTVASFVPVAYPPELL